MGAILLTCLRAFRRHMRVAVLVPLVLLLPGCIVPSVQDGGGDVSEMDGLDGLDAASDWIGCDQWHLHFDARAEDLENEAPPGYTVTADAAGLTTLLIHVTLCPDIQEVYLAVPVTPPPGHDDPDRAELATIQVFHAGHGPDLYPAPFSDRLVDARFDLAGTPAGPSLTVTGGGETFTLTNILSPSSGPFAGERWARIAHDGATYGIFNADGNESTNVGSGSVAYTHEGPGGAPPVTAGISHIVTDLDIHMTTEIRT